MMQELSKLHEAVKTMKILICFTLGVDSSKRLKCALK